MNTITNIFNNREISIFVWIVIFLIWFLFKKDTRKSALSVIQAFLKLYKWYLLMLLYITILVVAFYKIDLWDLSLLKNAIYWTFGGAFILFFNVDKALENEKYFAKVLGDSFKFIIIVEFLSNLYSFHIIIELILIPIIVFLGLMVAFSEYNDFDYRVKKFLNILMSLYALAVISFSIVSISNDFKTVFTLGNLKSLLFGSVMTVLLIPFLYSVALIMGYENFLSAKKFMLMEKPRLYKFLKWETIKRCNFKLNHIRLVNKKLHIYTSIERGQIRTELNSILKDK